MNLTCRVFGAPKPIITWWNGDKKVTGTRFKIIKTGDLQILVRMANHVILVKYHKEHASIGRTALVRTVNNVEQH